MMAHNELLKRFKKKLASENVSEAKWCREQGFNSRAFYTYVGHDRQFAPAMKRFLEEKKARQER